MANTVLSVIQPGGSIGTKYNIRSTGIRCFLQDEAEPVQWPSGGETVRKPADGCSKYIKHWNTTAQAYDYFIGITCSGIKEYFNGLTLSIQIPIGDDSTPNYTVRDDTTLQMYPSSSNNISPLGYRNIRTHSGLPLSTLKKGEIYVMQYYYIDDNTRGWIVYDTIKIGTDADATITSNNYLVPTGGAVYNYVNSMISQRWDIVVCNNVPAEIPQGAVYYGGGDEGTTGELQASEDTMYKIYLVRHIHSVNPDNVSGTARETYDEWITVKQIRNSYVSYLWEKIGNTDIDTTDIATQIADSIIGSIADHTVNEPTGIGTVYVGEHRHSIDIGFSAEGEITPKGTIDISTQEEHGYITYEPKVTISSFTPSGSVASTFIGTVENVAFIGTMSTITMSTYNVPVNANNGNASLSIEEWHHEGGVSVRPIGTIGTTRTEFITVDLRDGNHNHTMPSVQVSIATIDFTNNSSVITSTNSGLDVSIIADTGDGNGTETIPIPVDIKIGTQATYKLSEDGGHSHLGTLINVTAIATLSDVGSASVYSVENEILTLTPSVPPISTAEVTISQQPISISNAGNHSHTVNQDTPAEVTYDFEYYKFSGTTGSHSHSITGTYAGLIGTTVSSNTGSTTHTHQYKLFGSAIAETLSVSLSTIYMSGVIPHTHTVGTIIMKSEYTPKGMLTQSQTIGELSDANIINLDDPDGRTDGNPEVRPTGSSLSVNGRVSSTFTGTEVRPTANGEKVYFGFIGTTAPVYSSGQITGYYTGNETIGTKTVTVGMISTTLVHGQR